MKVYIIDDDIDIVASLEMSLRGAGHEVASQNDEMDLVENISRFNPAVIILDVMFPGDQEAGFKMARTIKHADGISAIPILMLTSVNQESDFLSKFSNLDIDEIYLPITEFIEKPIDPKVLLKKIEELTS